MDDDVKAMLTMYSGLAMHALILNRNLDADPTDLAQRSDCGGFSCRTGSFV